MNKDTFVGIVGAIVLVVAMVGVFVYERNNASALAGASGVKSTTLFGVGAQGTTRLGASTDASVGVTTANVTKVTFTLTWTATNGKDTLALTVTPPSGVPIPANATSASDSGTTTVTVLVPNAKPTNGPETLGIGEWKLKVEFRSATGVSPAPPPVPPVEQDSTVSWKVAESIDAWVAS